MDSDSKPNRVLFVEDEQLIATFVEDMLSDIGYEPITAGSAKDASTHAKDEIGTFCFALIDIGLPDRPGEELVAELKQMRPDLPVIIASGESERQMRQRFKNQDGLVFLSKPYDMLQLNAAIDALHVR